MNEICRTVKCINLFVLSVLCHQVSGFLDPFLGTESNVKIEFKWPGPVKEAANSDVAQNEYTFTMTTVDKEQYQCTLPTFDKDDLEDNQKNYDGPSPFHLLQPIFSKNICTYRVEPFWSYELCHGHYLLQFHPESGSNRLEHEYYLGKFELPQETDNTDSYAEVSRHSEQLPKIRLGDTEHVYFAMNMTGGTYCDVSGKSRFTRILYVCHKDGDNRIYSLKETSSCEYEVIVRSTLLCNHPAFRVKVAKEYYVYCYSYPGSPVKPQRLETMFKTAKIKPKEAAKEMTFKPFPGTATETDLPVVATKQQQQPPPPGKQPVVIKPEVKTYPSDPKLIEDFLRGDYCLRGGSKKDWWQYEFCYGKRVQQYHQEPNGLRYTILLGVWDFEKHTDWIQKHPEHKILPGKVPKQLTHLYSDGHFCDDVGKPRQVAVKLKCKEVEGHPNYVGMYLLEPQTCEYELTVESPVICSLVDKVDEKGITSELYHSFNTKN